LDKDGNAEAKSAAKTASKRVIAGPSSFKGKPADSLERQTGPLTAMMTYLTSGRIGLAGRLIAGLVLSCAAWSSPVIVKAAPVGSLVPNSTTALVGQPIAFSVDLSNEAVESTVFFGDGSFVAVLPPYPTTIVHAYAAAGTYNVTQTVVGTPGPVAAVRVTILSPALFSLSAAPNSVIAGELVTFSAGVGGALPGAFVDFGDGTNAPAPMAFDRIPHRYQNPGFYTATLRVIGQGQPFASAPVSVAPNQVAVPAGQVYSTFMVGSPVLAGTDTSIALSYRIFTPFVIGPSGVSPLQAIVELTDTHGNVIQRSDPFALPFTQQTVNAPQTVMIPYTVPADAGGDYLVRVYVRADTGGTVAVGRAQPLQIIGGPDPAPHVSNAFHASGAVLSSSGTNRGGYGVNMGLTTALQWSTEELMLAGTFDPVSKKIDPVLTWQSATPAPVTAPDATAAPNTSTSQVDSGHVPAPPSSGGGPEAAGSPTPVGTAPPSPSATPQPNGGLPQSTPSPKAGQDLSRDDPALVSAATASPAPTAANAAPGGTMTTGGAAAEQAGPAVTPAPAPNAGQPAPPPLNFKNVVGKTDASMPAVIGSKETLRGVDATYALQSGWTFHGGGGWLQLPSNTTTEETGELLDVSKGWDAGADALRFAYSRNQDNVNKFVQTGTAGPLDVTAGVGEFTEQITPHLKGLLTGGYSNSQPETGGAKALVDSVNQADLAYNVGTLTADVNYHNAGPQFGTLSGASALTDRAGGGASLNFAPSSISTLALTYGHDVLRSVYTGTTNTNLTYNVTPPKWPGITFSLERDTSLAPGSDATTKTVNLGLSKTGISSVTLTGTIAAVSDALAPESYSTTRTGVFTYQYANGAHTFGGGLNATDTTSAATTATVTESLNYGFTFGGRTPPNPGGTPMMPVRDFEMKFALTNVNTRALLTGGYTPTATGLLSWHITPQLAPGIEFNYQRHYDDNPAMNTETSFARFRLDVNY
jgi:hypothetical protein